MGILRSDCYLGTCQSRSGNAVVQGLGQRKARATRPVTGSWSGCCLGGGGRASSKYSCSERAREDGASREKVDRSVPGNQSARSPWRGLSPTRRKARASSEGGSGPSEMSPAGWNLERGLGAFLSASKVMGKGTSKGRIGWQRDRSLGPDWVSLPRQEALHLRR